MSNGGDPVAQLSVEIRAKIDRLKKDVSDAKDQIESIGGAVDGVSRKSSGAKGALDDVMDGAENLGDASSVASKDVGDLGGRLVSMGAQASSGFGGLKSALAGALTGPAGMLALLPIAAGAAWLFKDEIVEALGLSKKAAEEYAKAFQSIVEIQIPGQGFVAQSVDDLETLLAFYKGRQDTGFAPAGVITQFTAPEEVKRANEMVSLLEEQIQAQRFIADAREDAAAAGLTTTEELEKQDALRKASAEYARDLAKGEKMVAELLHQQNIELEERASGNLLLDDPLDLTGMRLSSPDPVLDDNGAEIEKTLSRMKQLRTEADMYRQIMKDDIILGLSDSLAGAVMMQKSLNDLSKDLVGILKNQLSIVIEIVLQKKIGAMIDRATDGLTGLFGGGSALGLALGGPVGLAIAGLGIFGASKMFGGGNQGGNIQIHGSRLPSGDIAISANTGNRRHSRLRR